MSRTKETQQPTTKLAFSLTEKSIHTSQNTDTYSNGAGKYQGQRLSPSRYTLRSRRQNYVLNVVIKYNHFRIY